MYGSQVWGTGLSQAGREFSSPLSTLHLHFLKGTLGVKQPTTNWAVLREPLQFFWFRSAVKPLNSMLNTNIFFFFLVGVVREGKKTPLSLSLFFFFFLVTLFFFFLVTLCGG